MKKDYLNLILDEIEKSPKLFETLEKIYPNLELIIGSNEQEKFLEAKEFLEIGDEDLKASKVLYSSKLYRSAVFHLQQATEKYLKAVLIYYFRLSEKEIRGYIRHDSPKATVLLLKKKKYRDLIKALAYLIDSIQKSSYSIDLSNDYVGKLEKLINKSRKNLALMGNQEITVLTNAANKLARSLESVKIKNQILDSIELIREQIDSFEELKEEEKRKILDILNKISKRVDIALKLASSIALLLFFGNRNVPSCEFCEISL